MNISTLPKITRRSQKRLGRGIGSGKGGHTSSRGAKGQHARNKVALWFEGGQLPLIKRLPFQRGKGRFNSLHEKALVINLKHLNALPAKTAVTIDTLIAHKLVSAKDAKKYGVKVLGEGKLEQALKVMLPTSKSAAKAIEKAGGSVETQKPST